MQQTLHYYNIRFHSSRLGHGVIMMFARQTADPIREINRSKIHIAIMAATMEELKQVLTVTDENS